jgi:hypothetical protein
VKPLTQQFKGNQDRKQGVIFKVSLPKAIWFLAEPEKPLQTSFLHPSRRLPHHSCVESKSCTYPDHYSIDFTLMLRDPALLFGASQSHKKDLDSDTIDLTT